MQGPCARAAIAVTVCSFLVLSACGGNDDADTDATATTDTTVEALADEETPTTVAEVVVDPNTPLPLETLPIDISALDPAAVAGYEGHPVLDYGYVISEAVNGPKSNPQPTFYAPLGTAVMAPVSGTVVNVPTLYSNDYSIHIGVEESMWVWETEHVIDVLVAVGDTVVAGQAIATVSDYDERNSPGLGLVELGLLEAGTPPKHHCPWPYLAEGARDDVLAILDTFRAAAEAASGNSALYDETAYVAPGCLTLEPIEG
jgi:biotin carboxyl carrier protein